METTIPPGDPYLKAAQIMVQHLCGGDTSTTDKYNTLTPYQINIGKNRVYYPLEENLFSCIHIETIH